MNIEIIKKEIDNSMERAYQNNNKVENNKYNKKFKKFYKKKLNWIGIVDLVIKFIGIIVLLAIWYELYLQNCLICN